MKSLEPLPYHSDPSTVNSWIIKLNKLEPTLASNVLYKALKALLNETFGSDKFYLLLEQLTPVTLHYTHYLETFFNIEKSQLDAKSRKLGRMSTNILRYMAIAYSQQATAETSNNQLLNSIYLAYYFTGLSLKQNAMLHERSSLTLWQKMSGLYQLAFNKNILDEKITAGNKIFQNPATIRSALNRNILFSLSNPYKLAAEKIDNLFSILDQQASLLRSKTAFKADPFRADFYWPYKAQIPPHFSQAGDNPSGTLQFNTHELIKYFQSSNFNHPFEEFNQIIDRLTGYQGIIQSVRPSEPIICNLMSGFSSVIQTLARKMLTSQFSNNDNTAHNTFGSSLDNLQLEPLEGKIESSDLADIWQGQQSLSSSNQTIKLQPTRDKKYYVAEVKQANCKINEPAILQYGNNIMVLAIIRQIQKSSQHDVFRVLIEKNTGIISHSSDQNTNKPVIFITRDHHQPEALLAPDKYITGSRIKLTEGEFILNALREETPHYMHYQLIPC